MERALYIFGGLLLLAVIYGIYIYNSLVRKKARVENGWSQIDVQLKRRYDLIPNLVETVKAYAAHERELFERITALRSAAHAAGSPEEALPLENKLSGALRSLLMVSENYPDLKANENFLHLQQELSSLENDIQMSRRYYNGAARDYNIAIATFPAVLVARQFDYQKAAYFEAEEEERSNPKVAF